MLRHSWSSLCLRLLVRQNSSPWSRLPREAAAPEEPHRPGSVFPRWAHATHGTFTVVSDCSLHRSPLQGFHVDMLTLDRVSPLHEACLGGHYACAKFLLENGANVRTLGFPLLLFFPGLFLLLCLFWEWTKVNSWVLYLVQLFILQILENHKCHHFLTQHKFHHQQFYYGSLNIYTTLLFLFH